MIGGSAVTCPNLTSGQDFQCSGRTITVRPSRAGKWSPSEWSLLSGTLFTIFEDIETLVGKRLYVDYLALFYSAIATAEHKMQGAIDTLVENANNLGSNCTRSARLFAFVNTEMIDDLLSVRIHYVF